MIYICEYDNLADDRILQGRLKTLLLHFNGTDLSGIKWQKMRERILARLLLDFALKQEYGLSLPELELFCDDHGKPCSGAHPEIGFNISHCSTACACAVGAGTVGIDIEKKFAYRENLARKVCHPQEWSLLKGLEAEERSEQMHFLWSMKESFVKWNGKGLAYGMERINLSGYLPVELEPGESCRLDRFFLHHTAAFTLAAYAEELPWEIYYKKETELL